MRTAFFFVSLALAQWASAQQAENIFVITTDGFRWQEVFQGADPDIINDPYCVSDIPLTRELFWDSTAEARRKKLMPFFWEVIGRQGQLYGNRAWRNEVNVKNPYKISYPGYNELLTGYADPVPVFNTPTYNKNVNVLEYLDAQPTYRNQVVVFSSWYIFPFLLNSRRNHLLLNSGYTVLPGQATDAAQKIATVQQQVRPSSTRYDELTFLTAREYIRVHHPKVVYISLGETDDFAHQRCYDRYLQQARNVDRMIGDLWYDVQTDTFYRNKTAFLITTDHGRGSKPAQWSRHNLLVKGSGEIWLALLGPGIAPLGEVKQGQKIFQAQMAATIAALLGEEFETNHPVTAPLAVPGKEREASMANNGQ